MARAFYPVPSDTMRITLTDEQVEALKNAADKILCERAGIAVRALTDAEALVLESAANELCRRLNAR